MRRLLTVLGLLLALGGGLPAQQDAALPARPDSVKFGVIGDSGTGDPEQYQVGQQMAAAWTRFHFDLVIMTGDNIYGGQSPQDYVMKFEQPYAALLREGVRFRASLGNHDNQRSTSYPGFNMDGARYYTYTVKNVRFLAIDSNQMDPGQLAWLETTLRTSTEDWKICYFHHPLYSDAARHGPEVQLRVVIEPLFVKYGVNVVFSGHDHIYERIKPQRGITYFVNGSSGELRKGNTRPSSQTAAYFDQDQAFTLAEVAGDDLFFQAISRTGRTVDSGMIHRPEKRELQ